MMIIKRKNLFNFQEKLREKFCKLKDYQTIKETEKLLKRAVCYCMRAISFNIIVSFEIFCRDKVSFELRKQFLKSTLYINV